MEHDTLRSYLQNDRDAVPLLETIQMARANRPLLIWSVFIFLVIFLFSFLFLPFFTKTVEANVHFVIGEPGSDDGALWSLLWSLMKNLFSLLLKGGSFLLSFLCAYPLVAPFYQVLSNASEDLFRGKPVTLDRLPDLEEMVGDLKEGAIAAILGFGIAVVAIIATFIPFLGPIISFALCGISLAFLMVRLTPARRGWDVRHTVSWLIDHPFDVLRLGLLPSLIILVPIISPFVMGIASPLFVMYATLLFVLREERQKMLLAKKRSVTG